MNCKLIFWQNTPSIHQAPLLRKVARTWPWDVIVVAESDVPEYRLAQGWQRPDYSPAELILQPSDKERARIIRECSDGDVHVFSGLHAYPMTYRTLKQISRTAACVGVMIERSRDDNWLRAFRRRSRYRLHALLWRRRLDFLLAMGEPGVQWFLARGFRRDRVWPFGYFVEGPALPTDPAHSEAASWQDYSERPHKGCRALFVGQLVSRKGVDVMLKALAGLDGLAWTLDVIGEGKEKALYQSLARDLGIETRVRWLGSRANHEVQEHMAQADVLVLPSHFDGWGAVVNEALMAGTRVIASDACGASELVREAWRGRVFESGAVEQLTETLREEIMRGPLQDRERARIRSWAHEAIAPEAAARYLIDIIRHVKGGTAKPDAPWRTEQGSSILPLVDVE